MKVIYVPGLEEGLKAIIEKFALTKDGGKIPILLIPDEVAKKTDLLGFLREIPAATVSSLGGVKLYSSMSAQVGDRTYGRLGNDVGGYTRVFPAQIAQGLHWAGVVSVYGSFDSTLTYAENDVYSAAAVNAIVAELKAALQSVNAEITSLKNTVNPLSSSVSTLKTQAVSLESNYEKLLADTAALAARVKALEEKETATE